VTVAATEAAPAATTAAGEASAATSAPGQANQSTTTAAPYSQNKSPGGGGSSSPGASGTGGGSLAGLGNREASKGVLLAIAIVLLWLAGLAFFVALEGSKLLGEAATPDGGGFFKALVQGINRVVLGPLPAPGGG
jgi:hypothetical protein